MDFIFTKSVDPKYPDNAFFHPDIFDYLPFDEYDPNQGKPTVPTLHLSSFATEWMDLHTAVDAYRMDCDDDDESTSDTSTFSNGSSTVSTGSSS